MCLLLQNSAIRTAELHAPKKAVKEKFLCWHRFLNIAAYKEGFSRDTGRLLLFFAAGSFLMAVLELFNPTVALVQMAAWTVAFFALWKKINDKYF